jgi:hypothetical protein
MSVSLTSADHAIGPFDREAMDDLIRRLGARGAASEIEVVCWAPQGGGEPPAFTSPAARLAVAALLVGALGGAIYGWMMTADRPATSLANAAREAPASPGLAGRGASAVIGSLATARTETGAGPRTTSAKDRTVGAAPRERQAVPRPAEEEFAPVGTMALAQAYPRADEPVPSGVLAASSGGGALGGPAGPLGEDRRGSAAGWGASDSQRRALAIEGQRWRSAKVAQPADGGSR